MKRLLAIVALVLVFGSIMSVFIGLTGWLLAECLMHIGVDEVPAWIAGLATSALGWCWWWFADENW